MPAVSATRLSPQPLAPRRGQLPACCVRRARFAVVEGTRRSDRGLTAIRNPGNVRWIEYPSPLNGDGVSKTTHSELILNQFTRQALAFSTAAMITDDKVLARIVECAGAQPVDTVLDVACGPGLVVCAFAPHVRSATGIDFTPTMLDRARVLAAGKGIRNVA